MSEQIIERKFYLEVNRKGIVTDNDIENAQNWARKKSLKYNAYYHYVLKIETDDNDNVIAILFGLNKFETKVTPIIKKTIRYL